MLSRTLVLTLFGLSAATLAVSAQIPQRRAIKYSDIQPQIRALLAKQGVSSGDFANFLHSMELRTTLREREGENDHLVYYLLQSRLFTQQPRIEPALSAREFLKGLDPDARTRYLDPKFIYLPPLEKIPKSVAHRIDDFVQALNKPVRDERFTYFRAFLDNRPNASQPLAQALAAEYERSMRFLYQKEFAADEVSPSEKGRFLASLYEERGHSTDTQIEANFAVWTALNVLKALNSGVQLNRVLIVGPGMDFAPRTGLIDALPPQSYQPFAVADALLGLGLATPGQLQIRCVDINPRVVEYLNGFPKSLTRKLTVVSAIPGPKLVPRQRRPPADYRLYFDRFGSAIGVAAAPERLPGSLAPYAKKILLVRKEVAEAVRAEKLNIITERYEPSPEYDLVVVTNVFVYFNTPELLLSLSNINSMMKEGGYLIHNEFRPELEAFSEALHLVPIQARTVRLSFGDANPMLDGFVIHRK